MTVAYLDAKRRSVAQKGMVTAWRTPITAERLGVLLDDQRRAFRKDSFPSAKVRRERLSRLLKALIAREHRIAAAISADFGHRSDFETYLAEIFTSLQTIRHTRRQLGKWMRPSKRSMNLAFRPARAEVRAQPLGVVGIISPWNYPFYLAISPLVGALAAGNRVMIKPSEFTPQTSELLREMIADTFSPEEVTVVTGGSDVGESFARLPLDHLLFTGSTSVGKSVMRAAAENLTPVTLELGGKSPAIIGPGFPMERAVKSIITGKLLNAGQTCIAPDYVMVPDGSLDLFVAHARQTVAAMYPNLAANPDYTSIINARHLGRLQGYLGDAAERGAQVVTINPAGESFDGSIGKMPPALVLQTNDDMAVMQEEIFGPILPVLTYRGLDEAIDYVNDHDRPLALYYFDKDETRVERVLTETTSGGVCINETLMHIALDDLPFGGVGPSGMGHYHGFEGFETFSNTKGVFFQSRINGAGLLRPPYGVIARKILDLMSGRK